MLQCRTSRPRRGSEHEPLAVAPRHANHNEPVGRLFSRRQHQISVVWDAAENPGFARAADALLAAVVDIDAAVEQRLQDGGSSIDLKSAPRARQLNDETRSWPRG
jgi:hypothetical protein